MWHKSHRPHFTDEETEAHEKLNNLTETTHLKMAEPRLYYSFNSFLISFKIFFLHCTVWVILGPQAGIEPVPPAVDAQNLNQWTTREVCCFSIFKKLTIF